VPKLRERDEALRARVESWAELLREARVGAGYSVWSLAKAASVPGSSLSDWERGRRTPPWWAQMQLAEALGLPVAAVFPRDDAELATAELARRARQRQPDLADKLEAEAKRVAWASARFPQAAS
jgi:DNA-binding XRE family transcriptional regulator